MYYKFIWGPLCYAIVICIAKRSPLRHPLQIIMCIGHLYGCILYYATSLAELYFNDVSHSRPEALYFWGYYVGFNFPWIIVPTSKLVQVHGLSHLLMRAAVLLVSSVRSIARAFRALEDVGVALQRMKLMVGERESEESRKTK